MGRLVSTSALVFATVGFVLVIIWSPILALVAIGVAWVLVRLEASS